MVRRCCGVLLEPVGSGTNIRPAASLLEGLYAYSAQPMTWALASGINSTTVAWPVYLRLHSLALKVSGVGGPRWEPDGMDMGHSAEPGRPSRWIGTLKRAGLAT